MITHRRSLRAVAESISLLLLTVHYRRPTPLGDLSGEAWIDHVDGFKTTVMGRLLDNDGRPTVETEGLFILPRWARELIAAREERPERFE